MSRASTSTSLYTSVYCSFKTIFNEKLLYSVKVIFDLFLEHLLSRIVNYFVLYIIYFRFPKVTRIVLENF